MKPQFVTVAPEVVAVPLVWVIFPVILISVLPVEDPRSIAPDW